MSVDQDVLKFVNDSTDQRFLANSEEERVVLVNDQDEVIGTEEKTRAHLLGTLHRAFSVFIMNSEGQLLVQKRALTKYHSGGLWSNTCCGHPRPAETVAQASRRRLREEMGFESNLKAIFNFVYCAHLEDGLIENEFDHVLVGSFEGVPDPNPAEISEWRWIHLATLSVDLQRDPENYTYWFRLSFERFLRTIRPVYP